MPMLPETIIQQSQLIGRLVLNRDSAEKIGQVRQFWVDTAKHQVDAVVCESGLLGRNVQFFRWEQVEAIGEDSLLLSLSAGPSSNQPEGAEVVVGHELWTDAGNKAGTLSDYCLDPQTGAVVAYLFVSNGWQGITDGTYVLMPDAVVSVGTKRLIAQEEPVKNAEQFSEGLSGKIAQAAEFLKKDYAQTQQDLAGFREGSQSAVSQFKTTAQQVTGQMQSKLSEVTGQVQETTQQVTTQAQEKLADATGHLRGAAQSAAAQVQKKAETIQTNLAKSQTSAPQEVNRSQADTSDVKGDAENLESLDTADKQDTTS